MLPDILTNAGGVTVSYFEWVQDLGRLFWGRDEIRAKLAEKLNDAFDRVWEISHERGISLRTAALVAGIRDVAVGARAPRALSVAREPNRLTASATRWLPRRACSTGTRPRERPARCSRGTRCGRYRVDEDGRLLGIVTRKTLVREVVAAGRDPGVVRLGEVAEPPYFTLAADMPLDEAFRLLEERDAGAGPGPGRRPLRRRPLASGVQRRLAEDEPNPEPDLPAAA